MLRTECSRRKVAWSEISTSAQKIFINTSFSDFSEEAESSDAGTDEDEACGEDERASVVLEFYVTNSPLDNTARHGENNSRPGSPTYHLSGPVISRSFPDNNSESSVRGDPPRSFALVLHDGEVSRPMYDPPTVNPAQLTLHNVRYSGSNIEESTFEVPNLNMAQNVERDKNLTRSMGMSVKDLVENVSDHHQQGMYYMVPPTSSTSHPAHWGESSSNVDPNLEQSMRPVLPARTSTNIDNTPYFTQFKETTLQPVIPSKRNHRTMTSGNISPPADFIQLPPTQKMICEIKKFFTDAMEGHGIHLQYKRNEPKLPWIDFKSTLKANRVRMENWPAGLEEPGRGLSNHPTKGIAGVKPGDLATIYRAIHHPTKPLRLIPDGPSSSDTIPGDSGAGPSRKRRRGDSDDGISRPKHHHGALMHFDLSSDS
ncbi:hypothetical protein C8J56DRAFT_945012 [Mycena floridula]|nr:hypothetical protein C8J56DRAFT_945012 [Mycena floridula]